MTFPFAHEVPTQEQFDTMNDSEFTSWWDEMEFRVMDRSTDSDDQTECDAVQRARKASQDARWN